MCDQPEFYRERIRVRGNYTKLRYCCECNGDIESRDKYVEISGKWEGEFNVFHRHAFCHDLFYGLVKYCRESGQRSDEMPAIGELVAETLEHCAHEVPSYWPVGVPVSWQGLRGYHAARRAAGVLPL